MHLLSFCLHNAFVVLLCPSPRFCWPQFWSCCPGVWARCSRPLARKVSSCSAYLTYDGHSKRMDVMEWQWITYWSNLGNDSVDVSWRNMLAQKILTACDRVTVLQRNVKEWIFSPSSQQALTFIPLARCGSVPEPCTASISWKGVCWRQVSRPKYHNMSWNACNNVNVTASL